MGGRFNYTDQLTLQLREIGQLRNRFVGFFLWIAVVLSVYSLPLIRLIEQSLQSGYSSHIVLVPLLAAYLIWSRKESIFSAVSFAYSAALQIGVIAAIVIVAAYASGPQVRELIQPTATVLSFLLLILAGFVCMFGTAALRLAIFPFGICIFMLPVPSVVVDPIIHFLQSESAALSYWMFVKLNVPVLRDGFVMTVPGVSIEVAAECSGINSSIALFILMILLAHETLQTNWRRFVLILLVIPLSIVKNAMRIVTLTMLAIRVDPGFLTGKLHHQGGFVFFLATLLLLFPIWRLLQRTERRRARSLTHGALPTDPAIQ